MRKMKNRILILLLTSASFLFATGGSPYTRYGIGDLILSQSARAFGMAETGIAYSSKDFVGIINPASWHAIELTRFSTGFSFRGYDISDKSNSAFYSETEFSGISVAFPISNDYGITLVGGITPYSNVNYDVIVTKEDENLGNHTFEYTGDGGLSKAYLGTSYKLPFDLSLGASLEYYNGKTDYVSTVNFLESTDFQDSEYRTSLQVHGLGYTFGLISPDLSKSLGLDKLSNLRIGATYNVLPIFDVDSISSYNNSKGFTEYKSKTFTTDVPERFGAGLSFTWDQNYTFLFDFVNQSFSDYKVSGSKSALLRDFRRYSLGFEYRHNSGRFGSTMEQVIWRAGLSYEESHYLINSEGIDELAAYAGFSFPMGVDNSLDFGFKYGFRGTTDNNLVKENIFSAVMTINFGDLWFIRPQR